MTIHLIKLSVGPDSLSDLENWQKQRLKDMKRSRQKPELMHVTRMTPKRKEVLEGGSIYWVIKGWIVARQRILELRPVVKNDTPHCGLVLDPELIRVQPRPRKAFQGWRYLDPKDAPLDITNRQASAELPEEMLRELSVLGLL